MSDETNAGMTLARRLDVYCAARGIPVPQDAGTDYLAGEVAELDVAIDQGDRLAVIHEIADVALALAAVAQTHGLSIEECIDSKTAYDAGRDRCGGGSPACGNYGKLDLLDRITAAISHGDGRQDLRWADLTQARDALLADSAHAGPALRS